MIGFEQLGNTDNYATRVLEKKLWKLSKLHNWSEFQSKRRLSDELTTLRLFVHLEFLKKPDDDEEDDESGSDNEEKQRSKAAKSSIFGRSNNNDRDSDSD